MTGTGVGALVVATTVDITAAAAAAEVAVGVVGTLQLILRSMDMWSCRRGDDDGSIGASDSRICVVVHDSTMSSSATNLFASMSILLMERQSILTLTSVIFFIGLSTLQYSLSLNRVVSKIQQCPRYSTVRWCPLSCCNVRECSSCQDLDS